MSKEIELAFEDSLPPRRNRKAVDRYMRITKRRQGKVYLHEPSCDTLNIVKPMGLRKCDCKRVQL